MKTVTIKMKPAAPHLSNEVRGCGFDTAKTDPNKGFPLFLFLLKYGVKSYFAVLLIQTGRFCRVV